MSLIPVNFMYSVHRPPSARANPMTVIREGADPPRVKKKGRPLEHARHPLL